LQTSAKERQLQAWKRVGAAAEKKQPSHEPFISSHTRMTLRSPKAFPSDMIRGHC